MQASGPGTQTLTWTVRGGDWMVVAMNADGSRPVSLQVNVAATLPALPWIAAGLLIGGIVFLAGGITIGYAAAGIQVAAGLAAILDGVWILMVSIYLRRDPALTMP